jgi:hypothetical protein
LLRVDTERRFHLRPKGRRLAPSKYQLEYRETISKHQIPNKFYMANRPPRTKKDTKYYPPPLPQPSPLPSSRKAGLGAGTRGEGDNND